MRHQRGFVDLVQIATAGIAIAALVGGLWAAWNHYESLVADNARLEVSLSAATNAAKEQSEENARLIADQARTYGILAKRNQAAKTAQKEADRYAQLLNDARRDPVALQWLDAVVPRAVWCGLRERPAGVNCDQNGKGAPAVGPDGGDGKPKTVDSGRLRLAFVLSEVGSGIGELQR